MTKTPTVEIRVLSVKQPWADCLMHDKWVENRSRVTHYRGPLWIQAGVGNGYGPYDENAFGNIPGDRLKGHIIGRVDLIDCVLHDDIVDFYNYNKGFRKTIKPHQEELRSLLPRSNAKKWVYFMSTKYSWIVGNPRWLKEPIPCTGQLGIFRFQADPESLKLKRRSS